MKIPRKGVFWRLRKDRLGRQYKWENYSGSRSDLVPPSWHVRFDLLLLIHVAMAQEKVNGSELLDGILPGLGGGT
jgi:hypothetical protein